MSRVLIDRATRRAGVSALYFSSVGVKQSNQLFKSYMIDGHVSGERRVMDPGELRVGVDALRDDHTLLDTTIQDSPHAALMRSLRDPRGRLASEYLERAARGTLDWRPPHRVSTSFVALLRSRFLERLYELQQGNEMVVRVAWVDDTPYIVDGKHRAALAADHQRPVLCEDVTSVYQDSYFQWLWSLMYRRPQDYGRHLRFWEHLQTEIKADREAT